MCIEMRQAIDDLTAVCWSRERDCYDRSFRRTRSSICRLGCVHKLFQTFRAFTTVKNLCKLLQRRTRFGNYNMLTKASAYQYIVEKNQDEMSRVIARSGLARHFGNIALISDDAVIFYCCRTYILKAFRKDGGNRTLFLSLYGRYSGSEHPIPQVGWS